jgi:hypothetical protein
LRVDACAALSSGKPARPIQPDGLFENWRSETALFLLSRRTEPAPIAAPQDLFGEVETPKPQAPRRKKR